MEVLRNTELIPSPEHLTLKARKAKKAPLTRNPTKRATIKTSPLRVANVRRVTKAQREAVIEAEASQEAKEHIEYAIKTVAVGIPPRVKDHISLVMQPDHNHHVDVVARTTEVHTPIVTHQHRQETSELNPAATNQPGALDAADPSVEEEEAQEGV